MSQASVRESTGFTVPDGAAMVLGAAVAAVHLRRTSGEALDPSVVVLFWLTFTGVAVTASGTFLYLVRRFGRRPVGYPSTWDRLWAVQGLPWVATSLLRSVIVPSPAQAGGVGRPDLYAGALVVGLGLAIVVVLLSVRDLWASRPSPSSPGLPMSWTARVGLVLAVAWPLQCGFGLLVTAP